MGTCHLRSSSPIFAENSDAINLTGSPVRPCPEPIGVQLITPALPFDVGDLLVVNASRAAVRAHLTSPIALAYYVDTGVRVLSSPNLHANVIATSRRAVIGSANASHSSTIADEAVVITDDPEVVAAARTFIDGIEEITEVDQVFLDNATTKAHRFVRTCAR